MENALSRPNFLALALGLAILSASPARTEAPAPLSPRVSDALDVFDLWAAEQVAYHQIPGLAIGVVHEGRLLWSRGYGKADLATGLPMTPSTPLRIGSVSKLFTATAILQLRDAGKLRLDDPVAKHLPWFAVQSDFADAGPITVEHLITHTSGLPREGAFPYWTTHEFPSREQLRAALKGQRAIYPPGEKIKYSNLGISLAGEVVAAVSGLAWSDYVDQKILRPLGMSASTAAPGPELQARLARAYQRKPAAGERIEMSYYDTGAIAPAAAVVSTVEDLAKFAAFHLGDPAGDPVRTDAVLSRATRKAMHKVRQLEPSWNSGRGWGFLIARREGRTLVSHGGWIGGHRADFLLDPARGLAVVAVTNADDAGPGLFTRKALDQVGPALDPPAVAEAKQPDPAWQRYLGHYTDPWGWEYQVLILDGGLALYESSYPPADDPDDNLSRLEPLGGHRFKLSDGEDLEFELDAEGKVTRIRRRYEYLAPLPNPPLWLKENTRP